MTTEAPPRVLERSIRSGMWLSFGYIADRAVGFFSFIALARLLAPVDFGIMAVALTVPKFLQAITEPGFSTAVIQKKGDVTGYLDQIWTLNIIQGIFVAFVVYFAGPAIESFFNISALAAIQLGGLYVLIQNLSNPGALFFHKDLDFKKIFIRNIVRQCAYTSVSIISALYFKNYWALILGNFALYGTEMLSTYLLHTYRPRISRAFHVLASLTGFSKWVFIETILDQAYSFSENAIVGRIANVESLGLYSRAKNLASVGPGFITSSISLVSFPAYAKIQDAQEKIREGYLHSLHLLFFFTMPIVVLFFIGGGKIILTILGAKWLPMTTALRFLLVYFSLTSVIDITVKLLYGIGYPDKKVKLTLLKMAVTLPLIVILARRYSIDGVAVGLIIGILPVLIASLAYLLHHTVVTMRDILNTLMVPALLTLLLSVPLLVLSDILIALPVLLLASLIIVWGVLYMFLTHYTQYVFNKGPFKTLLLIYKSIKP